jgi:hypothetical protein
MRQAWGVLRALTVASDAHGPRSCASEHWRDRWSALTAQEAAGALGPLGWGGVSNNLGKPTLVSGQHLRGSSRV